MPSLLAFGLVLMASLAAAAEPTVPPVTGPGPNDPALSTRAPTKPGGAYAVNTRCPIDGKAVDEKIHLITVTLKDSRVIFIGSCSEECAKKIEAGPRGYCQAAMENLTMDELDSKLMPDHKR